MLPTDLATLRANALTTLTDEAVIKRSATTDNGVGGQTTTPKTTIATVKARLAPARDPESRLIAEKLAGENVYVVWMPLGTDVHLTDEVDIAGRILTVVGEPTTRTISTLLKVICKELV